jgi:hypothetical protein
MVGTDLTGFNWLPVLIYMLAAVQDGDRGYTPNLNASLPTGVELPPTDPKARLISEKLHFSVEIAAANI